MGSRSEKAALAIWKKYERHLGNPNSANQDKDAFVMVVASIIRYHMRKKKK